MLLTQGKPNPMLKIKKIEGKIYHKPAKSYQGDAGWDVRSCERKVLQPGETHRFLLGFSIIGEPGRVYMTEDRSSMALKGLHVVGRVIDNGYAGEVSIILYNANGAGEIEIKDGDKIAQILVMPVSDDSLLIDGEKSLLDQYAAQSLPSREDKGTGSSGV